MADLGIYQTIIVAAITGTAMIVGSMIAPGINYLSERRRRNDEAITTQQEKEYQEIERRNQAYISFLSISRDQVVFENEYEHDEFNLGKVEEKVTLAFMHGSPKVSSIIQSSYPIESWEALEGVKKAIMKEIVLEKGEKNIVPLKGSIVTKSGMSAKLDETK
ncbi:MAG: hypothetical protein WBL87_01790 [Methanothrix sp.]